VKAAAGATGSLAAMPGSLVALRGATTLEVDDEPHMVERVTALLTEMMARNEVPHGDLVSIIFTATDDIHCGFPALAARRMGLGDVPLLCARELDVDGGTPRCVRVMMHLNSERGRAEMRHVYLEGARGLRDDLPE
jgi:chorismate mutase